MNAYVFSPPGLSIPTTRFSANAPMQSEKRTEPQNGALRDLAELRLTELLIRSANLC